MTESVDLNKLKQHLLPLQGNERTKFFRDLKTYVYVFCEITDDNKRIPIYIGKGKSDRCFQHLKNIDDLNSAKNSKINETISKNRLGIDILAYGLDDQTALVVESACIDLMGIDNLTNSVRGQGDNVKRVQLGELSNLLMEKTIKVSPEHKGVAILINRHYRPSFGDLEIFEFTRGIWSKRMKTLSKDAKYAYATFKGVVKDVYEIHSWVPLELKNTTESLIQKGSRKLNGNLLDEKLQKKFASYTWKNWISRVNGDPFIKVGLTKSKLHLRIHKYHSGIILWQLLMNSWTNYGREKRRQSV